jgi:hypothetical protein
MPTFRAFADFRCSRLCAKLEASPATAYLNRLFVKTGVPRAYKNCD